MAPRKSKILHQRGVQFIDVFYDWGRKRIPGSHYLEMFSHDFNEATLSKIVQKNQEVALYSTWGDGERFLIQAAARAVTWGFENVHYYKDGLGGWEKAGYPVDSEKIEVLW